MRLITALLAYATICAAAPAEPKVEMGEINGAKFRIDIPANWNGGLVMYCHGYSPIAVTYKEGALPPVLAVFTDQGYALAQSGYAAGGWSAQGNFHHGTFHGRIPDHDVHGALPRYL